MSNFIYRRRLGSLKRKNAAKVFLLWITGVGPVALLARFLPSKYLYDETMVFLGLYSIMAYFMFLFDNIRIAGIVLSPFLVAGMITSFFVTSTNRWNWVLGIVLLPAWLLMAPYGLLVSVYHSHYVTRPLFSSTSLGILLLISASNHSAATVSDGRSLSEFSIMRKLSRPTPKF